MCRNGGTREPPASAREEGRWDKSCFSTDSFQTGNLVLLKILKRNHAGKDSVERWEAPPLFPLSTKSIKGFKVSVNCFPLPPESAKSSSLTQMSRGLLCKPELSGGRLSAPPGSLTAGVHKLKGTCKYPQIAAKM